MSKEQINISTLTVAKIISVLLGFWVLYLVRDVVVIFFLAVILTATLDPAIDWLAQRKIRRPFGVIIIYAAMLMMIGIFVSLILPPLFNQFQSFTQNLPSYSEQFTVMFQGVESYAGSYGLQFNTHEYLQNILTNMFQSGGQLFATTINVLSFFISALIILALTFYMSVKEDGMNKFLISITPAEHKKYIVSLADRIKNKIGKWFAGQVLLMLIIFLLVWVALLILRIPYALILALLAGILEIVPYLGPIISAVLASMVGFLISPVTGLLVLGTLTIIQQLEGHVIVPQVMKKAVGLNPIVVILALLVGAKLGGTMGALLAVPIATSLGVFIGDLVNKQQQN